MRKITIEDVVFWLMIIAVIAIIIWKLFGSPSDMATIITIASILAGSQVVIWRSMWENHYKLDKKAEVGFTKAKGDLNIIKNDLNYIKEDINHIDKRLENIENLIKRRK